jgi:hypothetical protein
MPGDDQREVFERRVLALIREFLDSVEENVDSGYEIGEFAFVTEVLAHSREGERLSATAHDPSIRKHDLWVSFSTWGSEWLEEAFLREALSIIENERSDARWDARHQEDDIQDGDQEADD